MKKIFITMIALSSIFATNAIAQEATRPNGKLMVRTDGPRSVGDHQHDRGPKGPRKGGPDQMLQQVSTFEGTIVNWNTNQDFIYDGFELSSGGQTYFMKFPKELGQEIKNLGNKVTVKGALRSNPYGVQSIRFTSISSGNKTVYNQKAEKRMERDRVEPTFVTNKGKISELQINDRGIVDGVMLSNNILLKLPKKAVSQLSQSLVQGTEVSFTGYSKPLNDGELQAKKCTIIKPVTLTINGVEYML